MEQSFDEQYKALWNTRYHDAEYAYGKSPNSFFKEWLLKLTPGSILLPAEGEGRNGVFAAEHGWDVTAFDLSIEGKAKALSLAQEKGVTIHYEVGSTDELRFEQEKFDAMGLIYAHFAGEKKSAFHRQLSGYLRPGGVVIFEAFCKNHFDYEAPVKKIGGSVAFEMLFSKEELLADFSNYEVLLLEETEVDQSNGKYHTGSGLVIRFVGRKI